MPGAHAPDRTAGIIAAVVGGVVVLVLIVVLVVSSSSAPAPTSATAVPTNATDVAAALPVVPAAVDIPSIGSHSSLIGLGKTATGGWAVPDLAHPEQASWYTGASVPGQPGPAVILGHINGSHRPGVFAKLDQVKAGDTVTVTGVDGTRYDYRVDRVTVTNKAAFPTAEVLGRTPGPALRVISCGGDLRTLPDGSHSYDSSVIVWATRA